MCFLLKKNYKNLFKKLWFKLHKIMGPTWLIGINFLNFRENLCMYIPYNNVSEKILSYN